MTDIIFDLGGVLLDLDKVAMQQAFLQLGIKPEMFFVKADENNTSTVCEGISAGKLITDYQIGRMTTAQFLSLVCRQCADGISDERIINAWNACLCNIPKERLDLIKSLRAKGYGTHLLSNTNDLHWEDIKRRCLSDAGYTCTDLFDHVFVSHEVHLAKPDLAIYHHAVSVIGHPAEQCFFIDDAQVNVDAARRAGLQSAWLDIDRKGHLCHILSQFLQA